jgi:hypothetical protein
MSDDIDIDGYRADRGEVWTKIFDTLREYRMSNMVYADGDSNYMLVDLMSGEGRSIGDGEWEMIGLADEIHIALFPRDFATTQPPAEFAGVCEDVGGGP